MTPIEYLIKFSKRSIENDRILPTHVSLFFALICTWKNNKLITPFPINRKDVMILSKINSISTYHKIIRELQEFGFIKNVSSYNYYVGSKISFCKI